MKINEMPYKRYLLEDAQERGSEITAKLKAAGSAKEVYDLIWEYNELNGDFASAMNLARARESINTKDDFYAAEKRYYDESEPRIKQIFDDLNKAILSSPYLDELKAMIPPVYFINKQLEIDSFSDEIVPLMQEENMLTTEYTNLMASAVFDFDGQKMTLPKLASYKQSLDPEMRRAAVKEETGFYLAHKDEFDAIFDKLVKIRTEMARKMGYENYVQLGYNRMMRNSYNAADVERFRKQVIEDIVPAVSRLKAAQAKRIGIETLSVYDDALEFEDGNAKPTGSPDEILEAGKRMYREMSPETAEFIDFMMDNELLDVISKPGKAMGGYCTYIPNWKAPFIFANFNGTSGDVDVLTHEAGHAFNAYLTGRENTLLDLKQATMETCEIHSMSMEFFTAPWMKLFFGDKTEKYLYSHLSDAITFLPYGTMVDHFQHIVYENPDLTPAERNERWAGLEKLYRPYLNNDGIGFYGEGRTWQRQQHIYVVPFYYIDYCLAQSCALQFFSAMEKDRAEAWGRYVKLCRMGGADVFTNLIKEIGLKTPFDEGFFAEIVITADAYLNSLNIGECGSR